MREYRCIAIPRMISENDGIECPIPLSKLSIQWPGRPDQTTQITSLLARRPLCAKSKPQATNARCPFFPPKRTFNSTAAMSALGQERTCTSIWVVKWRVVVDLPLPHHSQEYHPYLGRLSKGTMNSTKSSRVASGGGRAPPTCRSRQRSGPSAPWRLRTTRAFERSTRTSMKL